MSRFEVIHGVEGCCLALDDTRIAGPKPWGGGTVIHAWETDKEYGVLRGECEQVLTDCDDGLMPPFTAHCSKCGTEWGFTPKFCPECGAKVIGTRDERKAVDA